MRRSLAAVALIASAFAAFAFVACGTSSDSSTFGDGGPDGTATCFSPVAATPAAGGGFCCAVSNPSCSGPPIGGWAATADECCQRWGAQDQWFKQTVDTHGCTQLVPDNSYCCGCPFDAGVIDTFACDRDSGSVCANGRCPHYWKAARQCSAWDPSATVTLFPFCRSRVVRVSVDAGIQFFNYSINDFCSFQGTASPRDAGPDGGEGGALDCTGAPLELEESCVQQLLDPTKGYPCANSAALVPYCEQAP